MRFIKKIISPSFFEEEKINFPLTDNAPWNDLKNPCKKNLKNFLIEEQSGLCVYCECDLNSTSHLEHIKPRSIYNNLKFEYLNLVVSCNGIFLHEGNAREDRTCGHKKNNEYNKILFLNPIEQSDIYSYFTYDSETGEILPNEGVSKEKPEYMIKLLNLNTPYLRDARKSAKDAIIEFVSSPEHEDRALEIIKKELLIEREFISYLKNCFSFPFKIE